MNKLPEVLTTIAARACVFVTTSFSQVARDVLGAQLVTCFFPLRNLAKHHTSTIVVPTLFSCAGVRDSGFHACLPPRHTRCTSPLQPQHALARTAVLLVTYG